MPLCSRAFLCASLLVAAPCLAQGGVPAGGKDRPACAIQAPATVADHVVHLAARPTVGGAVVLQPTSDGERARLSLLLREVGAEIEVPPAVTFVFGPQTDFFIGEALSPRPDSLAYPLVRGRILFTLHGDGRVTNPQAARVSGFPALDSAVVAALARAGERGVLAGIASGGDRMSRDSIVLALDLTSDMDVAAVAAPMTHVLLPQFRARPVTVRTRVSPRYPDFARASGIEGAVLVRFVVDESGRADPRSIQVLRHTRREFAQAVLDVVPQMRFAPATAGGCTVRLQVQQPFEFSLRR